LILRGEWRAGRGSFNEFEVQEKIVKVFEGEFIHIMSEEVHERFIEKFDFTFEIQNNSTFIDIIKNTQQHLGVFMMGMIRWFVVFFVGVQENNRKENGLRDKLERASEAFR